MSRTPRTSGKNPKRRRAERAAVHISMDDAAMLLLQLEPADADGFARARRALEQLASDEGRSTGAREALAAAAACMREAERRPEDADRAVAEASRLLEIAMRESRDEADVPPAAQPPATAPTPPASSRSSQWIAADADTDLLRDFVTEAREYVEDAQAALLSLESDPDSAESINTVFRAFHTIKGSSAFLRLGRITDLAHHAESLLDRMRKGEVRCTGRHADLALLSVDQLTALLDALDAALHGESMPVPDGYEDLLRMLAEPDAPEVGGERMERARRASRVDSAETRTRPAERESKASVRVRTDRLDRLIDLVGELVIAQSMLAQDEVVRAGGHHGLVRKVAHAGKLARELHDLSMSMRMVPLKGTFLKMARQVRDLTQKTGKRVELVVEGAETEIDRHMVDIIADPLMHMVRNAVDHGIEYPEEREAHGKPSAGRVRVSAAHAGGNVVVELTDDGRGLDRGRIRTKAVELGLVAPDQALTDRETSELIFAPGFSTAHAVTDVSGRGVGLDVVRRNIEALRGRIDIESEPGKGTRFLMRLPLTLAITDGMLVRVGGERYIVPTAHIQMSFRPERGMLSTVVGRGELVLLRGELLPIARLHRLLGADGAITDPTEGILMIVGDGQRRSALLVDELLGQQQVVAKPLGGGIDAVPGISGGAILGDGRVGLILDVSAVVAIARQTTATGHDEAPHISRSVA